MSLKSGRQLDLSPAGYCHALRGLLEQFCELMSTGGPAIVPYTEAAIHRYESYPIESQQKIYADFSKYVSVVLAIIEDGIPLENTERSLWCLFKKHQLTPRPDLFTSIRRNDFVTVYLPNHVQWYRSFNYFRVSSYSLGELICFPWHELYEHDNPSMDFWIEVTGGVFANQIRESVYPRVGPMRSRELFSSRKFVADLEPVICSPLTGPSGLNEALIVSWRIKVLDSLNPESGEKILTTLQAVPSLVNSSGQTDTETMRKE